MKTYKIKSLIYFCCFLVASLVYYQIEQDDQFQEQLISSEVVETDMQDLDEIEEDILEEQK